MKIRVGPALALGIVLGAALAGCGQKGPLYLPGNPSEMQSIEAPADGEPAEDDRDREESSG